MRITKIFIRCFLFSLMMPAFAESVLNEPILPISDFEISNPDQVELGRLLFHDARLSKDNQISCASCHSLISGGADGRKFSIGVGGQQGEVNAPTVFNVGLQFRQFWDGRAADLLEQVDGPVHNPKEMATSWEQIAKKLNYDKDFVAKFDQLYADGLTIANIKYSLVEFEKTLLTPNSRFDKFLRGDTEMLSEQERQGYHLFKQYGCVSCHQGVAVGGNLYQKFGRFGNYFADRGKVTVADYGRFNVTGKEPDRFVFKVPGLRNIALTAPYFHDGSVETLRDAIKVMLQYQVGQIPVDEDIDRIELFLKTLTGEYQGKPL